MQVCESPGGEQLGDYEARIASDIDAPSCSVLCQYDHGRFGPGLLSEVIEAHEVDASPELAAIGRDGELAAVRDRGHDALRLAGELDFGCAQTVSEVLDAHFHGPLRLDLADLSYVDVAGMRALRGHTGERLIIGPASDAVRQLLALLAWDTDPGNRASRDGVTLMRHSLLVYDDDDRMVEQVAPFLCSGLAGGERAVVVLDRRKWERLAAAPGSDAENVLYVARDAFYTRPEAALLRYDGTLRRFVLTGRAPFACSASPQTRD